MKIGFIVGDSEQHEMELSFNPVSGDLRILMDGTPVLEVWPELARSLIKRYELNVGEHEKHRLALQLTYGDELAEPGIPAVPRLSLMVTPAVAQGAVP